MSASYSLGAITSSVRFGEGERVDLSIQEILASSLDRASQNLMAYSYGGELFVTEDCNLRASAFPNGVYGGQLPCKDGYVNFLCYPYWWDRFCRMVGREDLIDDKSYSDNLLDPAFGPQIDALIYPWLLERTKIEVMDAAQAQGVPVAALNTTADLFADRQLRARGYFVELDHPETGPREYPGAQFKMSETPASIRRAPLLGEHTLAGAHGAARLHPRGRLDPEAAQCRLTEHPAPRPNPAARRGCPSRACACSRRRSSGRGRRRA